MRLIPALLILGLVLFLGSLLTGIGNVPLGATLRAYIGQGDPLVVLVMQELRLPRAALAVLIGLALGLAGAAMQGLLRNPLAEPGIVGTSGFAALGAVLALQTGLAAVMPMALPLATTSSDARHLIRLLGVSSSPCVIVIASI